MTFKLRLPLAFVAGLFLSGCAITDEFRRQGGFADRVLDWAFIAADGREHRVFRSYLLIGILARLGSESPVDLDDRDAVALRIRNAVQAAKDALICAKDEHCAFLEDRIALLDRRIFRLAVAVLYPEETRDLLARMRMALQGKIPVAGRALNAAKAAVELVGETGGTVEEAAGAINSLLDLSFTAARYSQRLGPLYRDSMNLDMRILIYSLEQDTTVRSCSIPNEPATYCGDLLAAAQNSYKKGSGDIGAWRDFLNGPARAYRGNMVPATVHWLQASDLVWRSCDLLLQDSKVRAQCRGGDALIYNRELKEFYSQRDKSLKAELR